MTTSFHLAIWIDRQSAHLRAFTAAGVQESIIRCSRAHDDGHSHHKSGTAGSGHAGIHHDFLKHVANAIGKAQEILIVGPADAKTALKTFLDLHMPDLAARVVGVEAMAHASGAEIDAFARRFFTHTDQLRQPDKPTRA